jgi:magnesium transporter
MNLNLNKVFIKEIETLIENAQDNIIKQKLESFFPQDIAEVISLLEFEKAQYIFQLFEKINADILIELEDTLREKLLDNLSSKKIAENVIENLETDDATDLIQEMSIDRQAEVLSHIEDKDYAEDIVDLLSYKKQSAGALMAKELIKVKKTWSVLRCLGEMRNQAKDVEQVYTIYVVDNNDLLIGTVSLKKLLLTPEKTFIEKIYNNNIIAVTTKIKDEEVANIMNKYDLIVLPVIDEKGKLVGRITIDDVVDFIKEEAEKDYQIASGIVENVESRDTIFTLIKARIPWLLIGLIGGIIGAKIVGLFLENEEDLELAFIPLIAAMAGNIGIQSAAIVVQELAGQKNIGHWSEKFFKELAIASINGLICGILIFFFCSFFYEVKDIYFPLRMSISLVSVMIYAALFGTFIPLFFNKININPALATGPFITTMNDVVGLFIYFLICNYLFI